MSFNDDVFEVVRLIPNGRVTSYGAIAKYLGDARASRRIGWALNKSFTVNPSVPAHRVVNRLGMLSGALHFPPARSMAQELENEGIIVKEGQVVELDRLFWDPMTEL
ncbi:MAG TPA: MGMT family protein [Flavobacteriales bacterium]|nr:MGMT family protein [Flavobacteriales bacterium]HHZ94071.1 MGMT family protein [Flavobacteriales bacterium]HIB77212.1 MGMT family protein [Flavobacteriales bacterium]HIN41758.1 MGMT family protein [Flavobacteriales bacterium]HIO16808.1 MGMT family protein [Flavobacteriales bacterium]